MHAELSSPIFVIFLGDRVYQLGDSILMHEHTSQYSQCRYGFPGSNLVTIVHLRPSFRMLQDLSSHTATRGVEMLEEKLVYD